MKVLRLVLGITLLATAFSCGNKYLGNVNIPVAVTPVASSAAPTASGSANPSPTVSGSVNPSGTPTGSASPGTPATSATPGPNASASPASSATPTSSPSA